MSEKIFTTEITNKAQRASEIFNPVNPGSDSQNMQYRKSPQKKPLLNNMCESGLRCLSGKMELIRVAANRTFFCTYGYDVIASIGWYASYHLTSFSFLEIVERTPGKTRRYEKASKDDETSMIIRS